jgi:putative pyruvate formate lyase activating enzyme
LLLSCRVCPRHCGVNRMSGERGFCLSGAQAVVCSAAPHFGEERPLVGNGGSGTIFFTSCNLKCVFCQNYEISHLMEGREVSTSELGEIMIALQKMGTLNINFVTPTHFIPQIIAAVEWAAENGLHVPLVYNTGGYDSVESLQILDGIIDIYMPDMKFMDSDVCRDLMSAPDYPDVVKAAVREMHRQTGDLEIGPDGAATRGLLVRHLVMPEGSAGTREVMRFLAREISPHTYVNIMDQYRPCGRALEFKGIGRSVTKAEYLEAVQIASEEGIERLDDRTDRRLRFF